MVETINITDIENDKIYPAFNKRNIAFCTCLSDMYAPYGGVLIQSLIDNNSEDFNYDILIFERSVSENNKRLLSSLVAHIDNFSLRFINVSELSEKMSVNVHGHFAIESCLKLFLMSSVLCEYEKIVVTDADLVFCEDVSNLFNVELNDNYMAAVDDVLMKILVAKEHISGGGSKAPKIPSGEYIANYLGLETSDVYFNTGVVVLNLKQCRKDDIYNYAFNLINKKDYWFLEQDVLNEMCARKAIKLDIRWNTLCGALSKEQAEQYLDENLYCAFIDSLKNSFVMHFAGGLKPWLDPTVENAEYWYAVARRTPWYEKILFDMNAKFSIRTAKNTCDKYLNISKSIFAGKKKGNLLHRLIMPFINVFLPKGSKKREDVKRLYNRLKDGKLKQSRKEMRKRITIVKKGKKGTIYFDNKKTLKSFKNKYKGKRCFIVGTGPSLNLNDLEMLKDEITFSLNSIYKVFEQTSWRPTFYVSNDIMLNYKMTLPQNQRLEALLECLENYTFNHCFVSTSEFDQRIYSCSSNKISFLPTQDFLYQYLQPKIPYFGKNCSKKCQAYGTTVYLIFQLARYMGFKEIYLLGTDCSYTGEKHHFYFSSNEDKLYNNINIAHSLENALLKGFNAIEYYSHKYKISLYNATKGGKLELFPRVNFDRIVLKHSFSNMNVGYISSDEYAPLMGVSLISLLEKNRHVDEINIYIFDSGISSNNREKIIGIAKKYSRNIHFIDVVETIQQIVDEHGLTVFKGVTSTYVKILPNIFCPNIDKLLVLDCDTIINQDLLPLYETNLDNKIAAAVPEITAFFRSSEDKNIIYKNKFYYNTGVLLFNLKKMNEDNFKERLFNAFKQYGMPLKLADQSLFNLTITNEDIVSLHMKYNYNCNLQLPLFKSIRHDVQSIYANEGIGFINDDNRKKIKGEKIAVIHYLGAFRPWIKWRFAPLGCYYKKYFKLSPWKNSKRKSYIDEIIQSHTGKRKLILTIPVLGKLVAAVIALSERYNWNLTKIRRKR